MKRRSKRNAISAALLRLTLLCCVLFVGAAVFLAVFYGENDLHSFSEPVLTLDKGWTLTGGDGASRDLSLPETISFGWDGNYTLSCVLPEVGGLLATPALRFYSNYVDVSVAVDGKTLYSFPKSEAAFNGATGNTYHFVRMPEGYAGKILSVSVRCQLGSDITYLLNPPLLGSKATMLRRDVMMSLPSFTLAGCMAILAAGLLILYVIFRKQYAFGRVTVYTALFTLLFSVYVYAETSFAQLLMPNGYMLCFVTLMLLALAPTALIGIFLDAVSRKFRHCMYAIMGLCAVNLLVQMLLNLFAVKSVRVMLPATHAVIVLAIAVSSVCMLKSDRREKPEARRELMSAVPMIAGGVADITLIYLNRPSLNNCFWFALGVIVFIISQFSAFVRGYFALYRTSLEAELLTDMAYHDVLAGIDNRNAYERKLKELSKKANLESLCCIVADINDLKVLNDTLGHQAGDRAIAEVGAVLRECMPAGASYFRTGGDEFVVLLEERDEGRAKVLAEHLAEETRRRGALAAIPISLAIGYGRYHPHDGNIIDFIRRVDSRMYECKRRQKKSGRA